MAGRGDLFNIGIRRSGFSLEHLIPKILEIGDSVEILIYFILLFSLITNSPDLESETLDSQSHGLFRSERA